MKGLISHDFHVLTYMTLSYSQEFKYKLSQTELSSKALEVTVWDYDIGKQNDYIGNNYQIFTIWRRA